MGNDTEWTDRTEPTEQAELPESTEGIDANRCGDRIPVFSDCCSDITQALDLSQPKHEHENHKCLFTLARAVKALELAQNRKWSIKEMNTLFIRWHERAKPFLQPSQSQDDYRFEFLEAYENANHPLGVDFLSNAWDLANAKEPPEAAQQFSTEEIRLLVSFCRELQVLCGEKPFFLSSRTVQRLFALESHATGARWLNGLCRSGILKVVVQGGRDTNKATRFRYQPPL